MAREDNPGGGGGGGSSPTYPPAWVNGPPPRGYTGQWPPPLPPGAQYGEAPGSIVYPGGSGAPPVIPPPTPTDHGVTPPPTTTTTTTPPPGGGPAPSTDLTYEAALAHANATAGTVWGRGLTAADIDRMKAALGFNPGAMIPRSALDAIDNWINANRPPRAGPPGPPTFDTPPPGMPPGSYGGNPPTYKTPDPFVAGTFTGPTAADLMADPSMKFRFDQGLQATQGQAASRGLLNTGNTLKDLLAYGQDFGSQEYKNVFDRSLNTFQTNEAGRFGAYTTNVQNQNNLPYANAADMFKNQQLMGQNAGQFNYRAAYDQWVQQYNNWRNTQNDWWTHATQVT